MKTKKNQSEVSFEHLLSLVVPISWSVDGIIGQTNSLSDPPFYKCGSRPSTMPFIRALGAAEGRYDVTKVAQRFPMFMYIRNSISGNDC